VGPFEEDEMTNLERKQQEEWENFFDWLKLLNLSEPVREAVNAGEITLTAAAEFAGLSPADQNEQLEKLLASGVKSIVSPARCENQTLKI